MQNPWTHSYSPISERLTIMKQKHFIHRRPWHDKKIIRWKANQAVFQFISNSFVANLILIKIYSIGLQRKIFSIKRAERLERLDKTSWFSSIMSLFPDYLELQRNQSWASDQKSDSHIPRGSMNKLVMDYLITGKWFKGDLIKKSFIQRTHNDQIYVFYLQRDLRKRQKNSGWRQVFHHPGRKIRI